jgi:hypothetical protein
VSCQLTHDLVKRLGTLTLVGGMVAHGPSRPGPSVSCDARVVNLARQEPKESTADIPIRDSISDFGTNEEGKDRRKGKKIREKVCKITWTEAICP